MKVARSAYVTLKSLIFAKQKATLKIKKTLPLDLFLETIPYEETRGYGRKLVSASVYYAWLYEGKSVCKVVSEIFGR